jgi:uncharacterized protein YciI
MRYVVFHTPGENWQYGVDFREQPGVMEHVKHYQQFHEQGKLAFGGPFLLEDRGGMMVTIADLSIEEVEAFAAADPAVKSGLLKYEVVPWHTPFEAD